SLCFAGRFDCRHRLGGGEGIVGAVSENSVSQALSYGRVKSSRLRMSSGCRSRAVRQIQRIWKDGGERVCVGKYELDPAPAAAQFLNFVIEGTRGTCADAQNGEDIQN